MKRHTNKSLMLICLTVLLCSVTFAACNVIPSPQSAPIKPCTYVAIDINPSVEMILDQNGIVLSAYGANTEAQIMLFDEGGIVGSSIDIALDNIFSLAKTYGYFDKSDETVGVATVSVNDSATFDDIVQKIELSAKKQLSSAAVECIDDTDLTLSEELRLLRAQNNKYNEISLSQYRLIKRAISADNSVDIDNAPDIPIADLLEWVQVAWSNADTKYGDDYAYTSLIAQYEYDVKYVYSRNLLYNLYIEEKYAGAIHNPDDGSYENYTKKAFSIQINDFVFMTVGHIFSVINKFAANPYFNETHAQEIYGILSPYIADGFETFMSKTSDINGNPTLGNIDSYINGVNRTATAQTRQNLRTAYSHVLDLIAEPTEYFESELNDLLSASKRVSEELYSELPEDILLEFFKWLLNSSQINGNPVEMTQTFIEEIYKPVKPTSWFEKTIEGFPQSVDLKRELLDLTDEESEQIEATPDSEEIMNLKQEVTYKLAEKKQHIQQFIAQRKQSENYRRYKRK